MSKASSIPLDVLTVQASYKLMRYLAYYEVATLNGLGMVMSNLNVFKIVTGGVSSKNVVQRLFNRYSYINQVNHFTNKNLKSE